MERIIGFADGPNNEMCRTLDNEEGNYDKGMRKEAISLKEG